MNTPSDTIIKLFNGKKIRIDPSDNYVNLTDMARSSKKKVNDFLRLENTTDFIQELSVVAGYPVANLLYVGNKSTNTWAHPQIAIKFAGWLSPDFEVLMTSWIFELLATGKVELPQQPDPKVLLFADDADIASNMAMAIAPRLLDTENDSEARLKVPSWLTVTEMLATIGHLREVGSIAMDASFRHWVNKDFCGLYRCRNGVRPPQTQTKRGGSYCYPPAYIPLLEIYLNGYAVDSPDTLVSPNFTQLSLLDSIAA